MCVAVERRQYFRTETLLLKQLLLYLLLFKRLVCELVVVVFNL